MHIMLFKIVFGHAVLTSNRSDIADAGLRRFLHDVTQLTGQLNLAFTGHCIHFDLQCIAADAGPGQTADDADLIVFIRRVELNLLFPQVLHQVAGSDLHLSPVLLPEAPARSCGRSRRCVAPARGHQPLSYSYG